MDQRRPAAFDGGRQRNENPSKSVTKKSLKFEIQIKTKYVIRTKMWFYLFSSLGVFVRQLRGKSQPLISHHRKPIVSFTIFYEFFSTN